MLAPTLGDSGQFETSPDKTAGGGDGLEPPTACTRETQKLLEVLAATLRSLSDEDRARLAELIQRDD